MFVLSQYVRMPSMQNKWIFLLSSLVGARRGVRMDISKWQETRATCAALHQPPAILQCNQQEKNRTGLDKTGEFVLFPRVQ